MKIKQLLTVFAIFIALPVMAQQTYIITKDLVGRPLTLPDACFQIAEIKNGKSDIAYLNSKEADGLFKTGYRDMDVKADTEIAVRYVLKNGTGADYKILLPDCSSTVVFYISEDGGPWQKFTTGRMMKWNKRNGVKQLLRIPYMLPVGKTVKVYQYNTGVYGSNRMIPVIEGYDRVVNSFYFNTPIYHTRDILGYMFLGFLAFVMVVNLFFYYVAREGVYITYAFTLFLILLINCFDLIVAEFFGGYVPNALQLNIVATLVVIIAVNITIRQFLRIADYYPKWDKFITWSPIAFFILVGVNSINRVNFGINSSDTITLILGLSLLVVYMVAFVVLVIKMYHKNPAAKTFVIAIVPFLIACAISIFEGMPGWIVMPAAVWTTLLISWRMFVRFKNTELENVRMAVEKEEERSRIIAEQNQRLEHLVAERTAELEASLNSLRETQNQLIQSEKMASLGELTAGIAHEIQNPLNFVNNFSDVSIELIDEMEEELDKGDADEVKAIAGDIKQNLEKIAHHGRRADSIVKGMLQHSRISSGQKEPTDINALADEYLRLAYHGLRAKDKSFNAELVTSFDSNLPTVLVIPQDLGRVLLNLFTNAFYATQQRVKQYAVDSRQSQLVSDGYKPTLSVTTKLVNGAVEIIVKDNGTGIPDAIKDKILQPFFTTKPTGEGTGLGLSLSYDIVVKGHGGSIDIKSNEGEGSEFIIQLPIS